MLLCRSARLLSAVALLLSLTACQGPSLEQRIAAEQSAFETWPAAVQETVQAGRIEVGFTPGQVRVAWGEPDDVISEISAEAEVERWIYRRSSPAIGIGFGFGNYGRSGGVGGSVGTTIGGDTNVVRTVRFENGLVTAFEEADSD